MREIKNFFNNNKKVILTILFITLLLFGLFIRLHGLGNKSFWIDEGMSSLAAKKIHSKGMPVLESGVLYGRARVFHYLTSGFLLFGYNEFNARLISVMFGLATCVLIFLIGSEYSKSAGWAGFIISLFLEIFVVYSRQARFYQMLMFFFFLTGYLLYKALKDKRYFIWAIISFLIAYNTLPMALILLPFILYVAYKLYFIRIKKLIRKGKWYPYVILGVVILFVLYLIYRHMGIIYSINWFYFHDYVALLKYYVPFFVVAILGFILGIKKKMTWFLGLSVILIMFATTVNKTFASRYIYLVFLPLTVFAGIAFSKIRFKWVILVIYMIWLSNLIIPFTYSFVLAPEAEILHTDTTEPRPDFRGIYEEIERNYNNETLIVTFTPAAEWYFNRADYWLRFSFSGTNSKYLVYEGVDFYTGADVIYNVSEFHKIDNPKIFVLGDWARVKIHPRKINNILENSTKAVRKERIAAYYFD